MILKKLINKVDDVVSESLAGMYSAHSDLIRLLPDVHAVVRKCAPCEKVALIYGLVHRRDCCHGNLMVSL